MIKRFGIAQHALSVAGTSGIGTDFLLKWAIHDGSTWQRKALVRAVICH